MKPTQKTIEQIREDVANKVAEAFEKEFGSLEEIKKKFSETEWRVLMNSYRYKGVEEAIKQAEIGIDMLLDKWEDICTLTEYMDSGEWQKDFEADERDEISKKIPRGVLAEDSLYNTLDRFQDVISQMAVIVDHVDFPEEEEEE